VSDESLKVGACDPHGRTHAHGGELSVGDHFADRGAADGEGLGRLVDGEHEGFDHDLLTGCHLSSSLLGT
jgi:hypothetical protein